MTTHGTRGRSLARTALATFAAVAMAAGITVASVEDAGAGNADIAAGAAIGLATGAIIGGAIASQNRPVVIYEHHRPARIRPWSGRWYRYCAARYRSFDPRTGYYRGYDGRLHFCR